MSEDVLIRQQGGAGRITLTRPAALHALNTPMCAAILAAVQAWAHDPAIRFLWIDHQQGTRGFCAGGDIRMLADSGAGDGAEAREFFRTEYRMNAALEAFPKPILAIIDGVTMGGGVGLSVHGSHRIATERTVFAMPETGIGLFPDVGGGWFLPRLRGELGTWLALTGTRLKGADVAAAGIATHFLPSELVPALARQLEDADFDAGAAQLLNEILRRLTHPVPAGSFEAHRPVIDRCFAFDAAEDIVAALDADGSDWARTESATLRARSPETVKVALRQLRLGRAAASFEDNMRMEFRIGWRKVQSRDFLEGVRAVLIDKDNAPVWSPARLEDVTEADVARYFAPLGPDELTFAA
ncbi:MAG: enoyl-CoA hydratase/isomerase family protein [Hyphomonas sp.]|uniref:enoyl-CoA hydratase/isomerase family protein n=1 Tax=Hyphomonas sp. TaxID=87 RepID=UPI001830EB9F|nr:enoyl-CoA hydratase/isomerase family protein [Hyphomonas sp.]MBU3921233.1 enoyl-CoA hydratase/isomerase family protein [Alphaproteobacteria bacterium]MBA3067142.1 enoyl-CoA hydratase/isomerase family protein [Hyphomonas sp.]MBU4063062.1 enoyl-CoA hydratase/isomerase family protein [Alphaproteobacteria bacterium]MBU4164379.1 enoyl-CoA hydratase/isomerase family protein [Alphaproteobacteria bacterium]MBU4568835.1 enoyl-CoA hydratase/isomerase family protein [Alphaproteobacteria bacterium]